MYMDTVKKSLLENFQVDADFFVLGGWGGGGRNHLIILGKVKGCHFSMIL